MLKFCSKAKSFSSNKQGATMVEYGLVVALIAIVCITAVSLFGTNLSTGFNSIAGKIQSDVK